MPIVRQVTVTASNRPGTLARIGAALAASRVNVSGINASGAQRQIRLLVNNPAKAQRVLRRAGVRARLEDAVAVSLADRPGVLGRAARKLAQRKININYAYGTVARGAKRATIVFGVSNPRRAARLLG